MSHCGSLVIAVTAWHEAKLDNYSWQRQGEEANAYSESNSSSSSFSLTLASFPILSVCLHLLFISVPLSTSVFLSASSPVSFLLHLVHPWVYPTTACLLTALLFLLSCMSHSVSSSPWPHFLFHHGLGIKSHSFVLGPNLCFHLSVSHSAPSFRGLSWQRVMTEKRKGEVRTENVRSSSREENLYCKECCKQTSANLILLIACANPRGGDTLVLALLLIKWVTIEGLESISGLKGKLNKDKMGTGHKLGAACY